MAEFPKALEHKDGWSVRLAKDAQEAHADIYKRAIGIYAAFEELEMDPWLNPDGNNDPGTAPQYNLNNAPHNYNFTRLDLLTKVKHRPFRIATLTKVSLIGGTKQEGMGVSLYRGDGYRPLSSESPALPHESAAFRFIDYVIAGLEQQAVDLGALKPTESTAAPAVS